MSHMETFYGAFQESKENITPTDTDEFYDFEKIQGKHFVMANGKLYEFWEVEKVDDPNGFIIVIPPADDLRYTRFVAHWYNGGAGIHEVVEAIIERSLK